MQSTHKKVASINLYQKSKTAFLIEGLDDFELADKPYYVDEWDFSTSHIVGVNASLKVSFRSTQAEYVKEIQDVLYKFYHDSKQTETLPMSVTQINAMKSALQIIADSLGGTKWNDLNTARKWNAFTRRLKNKKLNSIGHIVTAINRLTSLGVLDSYLDTEDLRKCAAPGSAKQHTAIPNKLYQTMLSHALKVVEKYHKYRHEISQAMGEAYDLRKRIKSGEKVIVEGKGSGRKLCMKNESVEQRIRYAIQNISHDIPDFKVSFRSTTLTEILTSCFVVVMGFSGTRFGEALSFNKHSAKSKILNDNLIVLLQGETTKGNDGIPKIVTWQSHPVAQTALELAYDMMESTRILYGESIDEKERQGESAGVVNHMRRQLASAFLMTNSSYQNSDNYLYMPDKHLKSFIKKLDYKATYEDVEEFNLLNPTREGQLKVGGTYNKLSSHDLRRTFAVFFVRYGFGTVSGIKFQFKHQNINMSGYYANNAVLAQMNDIVMDSELIVELKDAGIDLGVDQYYEIYNESKNLSGSKGEEIKQDRLKMLDDGEGIIMTRAEIEEHIRTGDFNIIQLPNGAYCTNVSCDRVCGSQPFRAEIKECAHKVVTDKGAKKVAKQRERLITKFKAMNTGDKLKSSILTGLKQKIQSEELTLKKHEIPYVSFKDEIIFS